MSGISKVFFQPPYSKKQQKPQQSSYVGPKIVTHQKNDTQYGSMPPSKVNRDRFLTVNQVLHPELHTSRSFGTLHGTISQKHPVRQLSTKSIKF